MDRNGNWDEYITSIVYMKFLKHHIDDKELRIDKYENYYSENEIKIQYYKNGVITDIHNTDYDNVDIFIDKFFGE